MSSDLERRLEAMFADSPEPEAGAGEEALHRALRALHPVHTPRRGLRTGVLAFAGAIVLLVIAAGSLGAAGALHVSFGTKAKKPPAASMQLRLPRGADGILAIVDGRLSVVTKTGFRLEGFQASAATLSPHAVYVAAGIRNSLVAMAPDGRRPWSHPAGGRVVAIAWAPDAIRIAYVVHVGHRFVLHLIWGTGTNDTIIDTSVRPVTPSWRRDSLAFAYVGAGGKAIVYDLGHRSRKVAPGSPQDVTQVAFASSDERLALLGRNRVLVGKTHLSPRFPLVGIGWFGGRFGLVGRNGQLGPTHVFGRIVSFQSSGDAFAAVLGGSETHVVAGTLRHITTVLELPVDAHVETVVVR
jgi:hypothetical protein